MKRNRHRQPSRVQPMGLRQLVELIPACLVPKLAREHGAGTRSRTFSPWSHVVALLFAQLARSLSLNDICDALRVWTTPLRAMRGAPSRNPLGHANKVRDCAMAEALFRSVLEHLQDTFPGFRWTKGAYTGVLRRVCARVKVDGQERELVFLTNPLTWSAASIAELYRCRWQIEAFFKQIKQTLQLADFPGRSANAVTWRAPLVCVLLRFIAWRGKWAHSFSRLFTLLRAALWQRGDLAKLLDRHGTADGHFALLQRSRQSHLPGFAT